VSPEHTTLIGESSTIVSYTRIVLKPVNRPPPSRSSST